MANDQDVQHERNEDRNGTHDAGMFVEEVRQLGDERRINVLSLRQPWIGMKVGEPSRRRDEGPDDRRVEWHQQQDQDCEVSSRESDRRGGRRDSTLIHAAVEEPKPHGNQREEHQRPNKLQRRDRDSSGPAGNHRQPKPVSPKEEPGSRHEPDSDEPHLADQWSHPVTGIPKYQGGSEHGHGCGGQGYPGAAPAR